MARVLYSEIVKDLRSAREFCVMNKIRPEMLVVIWAEDDGLDEPLKE